MIDLSDLLAQLFYNWKWILVVGVIGMAAGMGCYLFASQNQGAKKISQEDIEAARALLPEDAASNVEQLHIQYESYIAYRKELQSYLSDSLYKKEDFAGNVGLTSIYYVNSVVSGYNLVLAQVALGTSEYEKIAEILNKDISTMDDVYRRVSVGEVVRTKENGVSLSDVNVNLEEAEAKEKKTMLLQVDIVAENQEQANAVLEVVEEALSRQIQSLQEIDPEAGMKNLGKTFTTDVSEFLDKRQNNAVNYLNTVNNQIAELQSRYVEPLESDEKSYYNLLKKYSEQDTMPIKEKSLLLFLLIGAILGVVLSGAFMVLRYIFDGTVKSGNELAYISGDSYLDTLYRKKRGFHLFGGISRLLMGALVEEESHQINMLEVDLEIKVKKMGCHSVYMVCEKNNDWGNDIGTKVQKGLQHNNSNLTLQIGDPLEDSEDREVFSQAEAVVLLVRLKKTSRREMLTWIKLCQRYGLQVAGIVALDEC